MSLRRLIASLATLVVSLLGPLQPAAATAAWAVAPAIHTPDDSQHAAAPVHITTVRGPPASHVLKATHTADRWSRGASERLDRPAPPTIYDYDVTARLVARTPGSRTVVERDGVATWGSVVAVRSDVAAETGETVASTAGRDAAESCLNSFTGDTPVTMADGSERSISKVEVGDKVLATDPETGETKAESVTALIRHAGRHKMVLIALADGSILDSTDGHPIWDATAGRFTVASRLRTGDQIQTAGGELLTITSLTDYNADLTAYNLQIEQIHTYFAGATPVLVHNSCPHEPNFEDPTQPPGEGWEWRGPPDKGSWFNPATRESLHPDLDHPDPIGPHYDWRDPLGTFWRIFPDGSVLPK